ncbi:MAG TPA: ABC transporter substrate-binding protein [Geminicoccaceae bacterium]|nr:ABC transporter substrate-binding protein [Geminicoccaceae bacterium]
MGRFRQVCLATAVCALVPALASAQEMQAEVIHWWTSGGESAAVKVFADQFESAGGTWIDNAVAGGSNARTAGINRIVGGDPPTAMQFNTGLQFDEIVGNGFLRDLEEVAAAGKWREVLPEAIIKATNREDKFYAVPVNIHGQNWLWYNTKVFADAGVEPPRGFEEMIEVGPKLKDAGVVPMAFSGEPNWERFLFNAVLLGKGGSELYLDVLGNKNIDAVNSDGFREVAETFIELRDLVDEGSPGRKWNDATNMVITGQAAMQVMGDWAKGEFIAAGQTAGEEYGCTVLGGGYIMGGDVFVFPIVDDPAKQAAQVKLAELMMAPETQIEFNKKKGSVPVRLDVDVSSMDVCAQQGMAMLQDAEQQIPSDNFLTTPDMYGALQDVITEYWNSPSMDVDTFVENYASAMEAAS